MQIKNLKDYKLSIIVATYAQTGGVFIFPILRWVRPNCDFVIQQFDTSLPQFDKHEAQRKLELEEKRKTYLYDQKQPGLPVVVSSNILNDTVRYLLRQ
jgi:hypothetical protein